MRCDITTQERALLPHKTLRELEFPAPEGSRHQQIVYLLPQLFGNGLGPDRVFELLRPMYRSDPPNEVTDSELWRDIRSAQNKGFGPSGWISNGGQAPAAPQRSGVASPTTRRLTPQEKIRNAEKLLGDYWCPVEGLRAASQVEFTSDDLVQQAILLLRNLYGGSHAINTITEFYIGSDGRVNPCGAGLTKSVFQWTDHIKRYGVPRSIAGAWFRINPVKAANLGSGHQGAYTDRDVDEVLYVLVESDVLPLELQSSMFGFLMDQCGVPFSSIVDSGGRSLHGLVRVSGKEEAKKLLGMIEHLGFDVANANPSRLARLPGAIRKLGSRTKEGRPQKLIYLAKGDQP